MGSEWGAWILSDGRILDRRRDDDRFVAETARGLLTGPNPPFAEGESWRDGAGALPPVNRQLFEQEIFQHFVVAGQDQNLFPGQFQSKALHPKMTDLDRETTVIRFDLDPGVRPQVEENEAVQLVQKSVLRRFPGVSSASFDQTSAPTPGEISPVGDSGKATSSFRSCERFMSWSRRRPREMNPHAGAWSAAA